MGCFSLPMRQIGQQADHLIHENDSSKIHSSIAPSTATGMAGNQHAAAPAVVVESKIARKHRDGTCREVKGVITEWRFLTPKSRLHQAFTCMSSRLLRLPNRSISVTSPFSLTQGPPFRAVGLPGGPCGNRRPRHIVSASWPPSRGPLRIARKVSSSNHCFWLCDL